MHTVAMERYVGLREVALHAGVHHSTVARVLKGNPAISRETTARVKTAINDLGYQPDPRLSALAEYRRQRRPPADATVIAWVNIDSVPKDHPDYWFGEAYRGAQTRASEFGYRIEEFCRRSLGVTLQRLMDIIYARGINGVIFDHPARNRVHLRLPWERFSMVKFGYEIVHPTLDVIVGHHFHKMRLVFRTLRKLGYKKIGAFLLPSNDERVNHQWSAAYLWEQQRLPPSQHIPLAFPSHTAWGEEYFRSWLKRVKPDAIIINKPNPYLDWLKKLRLNIPDDIGVASMYVPSNDRQLSGINPHFEDQGRAAVDRLITLLNTNQRGVPRLQTTMLIEPSWQQGHTAVHCSDEKAAKKAKLISPKPKKKP